jgi:hypothetical protein
MHISEPIVSQKELLCCKVDNSPAHEYLWDAVKAVKNAGIDNPRDLQASVIKSMLVFPHHREEATIAMKGRR